MAITLKAAAKEAVKKYPKSNADLATIIEDIKGDENATGSLEGRYKFLYATDRTFTNRTTKKVHEYKAGVFTDGTEVKVVSLNALYRKMPYDAQGKRIEVSNPILEEDAEYDFTKHEDGFFGVFEDGKLVPASPEYLEEGNPFLMDKKRQKCVLSAGVYTTFE